MSENERPEGELPGEERLGEVPERTGEPEDAPAPEEAPAPETSPLTGLEAAGAGLAAMGEPTHSGAPA
ncbi:MAG TPA: hypothetical protein GX743_06350, partial [Actinomycetales bacterium]|nr:hypothetical protein [Actinomycetales bacterium]